jgi:hypothetical protein
MSALSGASIGLDVNVYAVGLCSVSACAGESMTREEVAHAVNVITPTGVCSRWRVSDDLLFADGIHPNPCACNTDESRKHWLLEC